MFKCALLTLSITACCGTGVRETREQYITRVCDTPHSVTYSSFGNIHHKTKNYRCFGHWKSVVYQLDENGEWKVWMVTQGQSPTIKRRRY